MTKHSITLQDVVLRLPGMDTTVRRDLAYDAGHAARLRMNLYRPSADPQRPLPAIVLVTGYSDIGSRKILGCSLMEMASYIGWAKLIACAGMTAVTYETEDPIRDARALFDHLKATSVSLGIDASRLGVWSCSGNVPNALALIHESSDIACAVLCYGYTTDEPGFSEVSRAAEQFGFVNPASMPTLDSLRDVPMLIVRAGRDDTPGLQKSLDRFVTRAIAENLYVSVLNQPDGRHAFDIFDDTNRSRSAIRHMLEFFKIHLFDQAG